MAFDTRVTNCNYFKKLFKNYQKNETSHSVNMYTMNFCTT